MSTPFEIFRKQQKVWLASVTGLSILAFVISDATNNNVKDMPPPLIVATIAVLVGGAAWVFGSSKEKGSEYGTLGAAIGAVLGLAFVYAQAPQAAMQIGSQRLTQNEVTERFNIMNTAARFRANFQREVSGPTDESIRDREVMLQEADRLGIAVSDDTAVERMKKISGDTLTQEKYQEIKKNLNVGDEDLLVAFKAEARAEIARTLLMSDQSPPIPPAALWNAYQKLNSPQTATIAKIPVSEFVNAEESIADSEIQKYFEQYKKNVPNYTFDRKPAPGQPGFYQFDKVRLAYLEADIDAFKEKIPVITDEEVQAEYDRRKAEQSAPKGPKLELNDAFMEETGKSGVGELPPLSPLDTPAEMPAETPPANSDQTDLPAGEKLPIQPASEAPVVPTEPQPEATSTPEAAKPETPAEPESSPPAAPEAKPEAPTSSIKRRTLLQLTSFNADETPAATEPAATEPAATEPAATEPAATEPAATEAPASAPATETPAEKPVDVPVETPAATPAEAPAAVPAGTPADATTEKPADAAAKPADEPAPPSLAYPALDDELKGQIREDLLQSRAQKMIEDRMLASIDHVNEILGRIPPPKPELKAGEEAPAESEEEVDPTALSPQQARDLLEAYAKEQGFTYRETPLMNDSELMDSEEHPVGSAMVRESQSTVTRVLFSNSRDQLNYAVQAHLLSGSQAVVWKIQHDLNHEPKSLDVAGLKEKVVEAIRTDKARPLAQQRAEELVKLVKDSDKPLTEILSEQTITGKAGGVKLNPVATGSFTWMKENPFAFYSGGRMGATISTIPDATDVGDEFMKYAFETLKPGEVGVAPNADHSALYLIKVETRESAIPDEFARDRATFLVTAKKPELIFSPQLEAAREQYEMVDPLGLRLGKKYGLDSESESE